jgi:serine/threonine-protein kinase
MELLQGVTLAQLQKRCAPMPVGVTARLLAACARGLRAAHEAKGADGHALDVVHRDVCQQNIHVTFDGHVRVVDFGIAAARGKLAETQSGEIKGHFTHLSPEQIGDPKAVDRRADIWALGVMAWECLVGVDLFRDESHSSTLWNVLNKSVPNVRDTRAEVPEELAELIASCLSRDLAGRPSTAQEVAIRLEAIASGLPESDPASLVGLLRHRFTEEIEGAAELGSRAATPVVVADQRLADDAAAIPTSSGAAPLRRLRWTLAIGLVAGATLAGVAGWAATGSSDGPPRIGAEPAAPEDPGVLAAVESPEAAPPDQPTGEIAAAADEGADSPTAPSASAAMEGTSRRQGRRARRRAAPRAEPDEPLGRRSEFLESPYAASE